MRYLIALLLVATQGCAAATPLLKSALQAVGPAAVDTLTQVVLDEYGEDATLVVESAGCFPVSEVNAETLASMVGDDQQEYAYISCRVKVRQ